MPATVALVSTQLGQTLIDSHSPLVVSTAAGSLVVLGGLDPRPAIAYVVSWDRTGRPDRELARGVAAANREAVAIDLAPALAAARRAGLDRDPYLTVRLARWGAACEVHLRVAGDRIVPVGVSR